MQIPPCLFVHAFVESIINLIRDVQRFAMLKRRIIVEDEWDAV